MKKILILASNPRGDLNLNKEIKNLKRVIENSPNPQQLQVEIELLVYPDDLHDLFFRYEPRIVHFCGHGTRRQGLVFENENGREHQVGTEALSNLFQLFADKVECVVLNACYTKEQVNAISKHINYVIGMKQTIQDNAAIAFATGFYRALGYGRTIEDCFKFGCSAIELKLGSGNERKMLVEEEIKQVSLPENLKPLLKKKRNPTNFSVDILPEQDDSTRLTNEIEEALKVNTSEVFLLEKKITTVTLNNQGEIIKKEPIKVESFVENLGNGIELEMVLIPGGSFQMGANENIEEQPVHKVTIQPFFMSKYPITQEQWTAVANLDKVNIDLKLNPSKFIGKNLPVERVNWFDIKEFCARLSQQTNRQYRLPSEAEWEYACRAGSTTPFYFGETMTTDVANYNGNYIYADEPKGEYREKTTPVDNFPPNAFGLCDMHGNIWEWCEDPWHSNYEGAPTDGSIWQENDSVDNNCDRLLRGGSWYQQAKDCRCACRNHIEPDSKWNIFGFRIVVIKI